MRGMIVDQWPLWLVYLGTVAIAATAIEAGFRLGRSRRNGSNPEKEQPVAAIAASTLGLLGFMLAFTFGLAASRFDDRRLAVLEEANAIGTTYLRAGLLVEPERSECRELLRAYVNARMAAVKPETHREAMATSTSIHDALWTQATAAAAADPHSIMTGLFIESLNNVIDLHATRVLFGLRSQIPSSVWVALFSMAALAMGSLGYQEGLAGSRRSLATIALLLTFSAVMLLIADLDRPQEGLLRVGQQSMIDLQESMRGNERGIQDSDFHGKTTGETESGDRHE
jgi:hypothetical protein